MMGEMIEEDGKSESVAVTNALMIRPAIWIELDSEYFRSKKACEEAHDDILANQKMKLDGIINSLSECARAQEMIQKLESMKSSCDDAIYQQLMDVLKGRAQIERMYGVNHERTVRVLKELG